MAWANRAGGAKNDPLVSQMHDSAMHLADKPREDQKTLGTQTDKCAIEHHVKVSGADGSATDDVREALKRDIVAKMAVQWGMSETEAEKYVNIDEV